MYPWTICDYVLKKLKNGKTISIYSHGLTPRLFIPMDSCRAYIEVKEKYIIRFIDSFINQKGNFIMEIKEFIQNFADQFDDTDASVFTSETKFKVGRVVLVDGLVRDRHDR